MTYDRIQTIARFRRLEVRLVKVLVVVTVPLLFGPLTHATDITLRTVDSDYRHDSPKMNGLIGEVLIDGKPTGTYRVELTRPAEEKHRWKRMSFAVTESGNAFVPHGRLDVVADDGEKIACYLTMGRLDGVFTVKFKNGSKKIVVARFREDQISGTATGYYEDGKERFSITSIDGRVIRDVLRLPDGREVANSGKPMAEINELRKELGLSRRPGLVGRVR